MVLSFFRKFSRILKKEEKHCNSENTEDFREVQRQIYCKIVQVSSKPFSAKKRVIEFSTQLIKDLKPMLRIYIYLKLPLRISEIVNGQPFITIQYHFK